MNRAKLRIPWVEIVVAVAILLIIARLFWTTEISEWIEGIFNHIGISKDFLFIVTILYVPFLVYHYYHNGKKQLRGTGRRVIESPVRLFASFSFIIVVIMLVTTI